MEPQLDVPHLDKALLQEEGPAEEKDPPQEAQPEAQQAVLPAGVIAAWAGCSQCRAGRPPEADRPRVLPHTPTEPGSCWDLVTLAPLLLSTMAQQPGKTWKTWELSGYVFTPFMGLVTPP